MKIAIVGTSVLTGDEEIKVRLLCQKILKQYNPLETTVISGGAQGVDSIATTVALCNNFAVREYFPIAFGWKGFKKRNLEMAEACDKLYCITTPVKTQKCYHHKRKPQDHEKTAGCWTMLKVKELDKPCKLMLTSA